MNQSASLMLSSLFVVRVEAVRRLTCITHSVQSILILATPGLFRNLKSFGMGPREIVQLAPFSMNKDVLGNTRSCIPSAKDCR
mmetsp:Transcript_22333/g.36957  ORF Transcript_22333/g.36957 Transcript_22333/m.36957 type:complete len:83 (+) Transcript_22333:160-408(+)